jgi:phosphoserine phosphatase RsbU/P
MKILLVDDEPAILSIQSEILSQWGYEVEVAQDGHAAWEKMANPDINFVISDWIMPGISGVDLCRKIREAKLDRYVYLLLCTAKDRQEDIVEGLNAGADDFLVKPIDLNELRVRIRSGERVLNLERKLENHNLQLQQAYDQIRRDLKAAAAMQMSLLPSPSPKANGIQGEWFFYPSHYVAGDIFNLCAIDESHVGFYILDVSGHGVPAAMLSVTLSMLLRPDAGSESLLKRWNPKSLKREATSPELVLADLNRRFQNKEDRYFTMVYGIYDHESSRVQLSLAGQPRPLLLRASGKIECLGEGGYPIGIWPESEYECFEVPVEPGDRLIFYSDGISECRNSEGQQFGETRIFEHFQMKAGMHSLKALLTEFEQEIQAWNKEGTNFEDDITMLALEFNAKAA